MKKKPIIGIVSRIKEQTNSKVFLGCYNNYLKKIVLNGGIPLLILPTQINFNNELSDIEKTDLEVILKKCDGILMPGGDDPSPYDIFINDYAYYNDIPILGICLGMQVMAIADGSNLIRVNNHYLANHDVVLKNNTLLKKVYDKNIIYTNSRHKYKLDKTNKYTLSALSFDGVIEGIEDNTKRFNVGVEWHPEDLTDNSLFKYFIDICRK